MTGPVKAARGSARGEITAHTTAVNSDDSHQILLQQKAVTTAHSTEQDMTRI